MSIVFSVGNSVLLSHKQFVDEMLKDVHFMKKYQPSTVSFELSDKLFQYDVCRKHVDKKKRKRKLSDISNSLDETNSDDNETIHAIKNNYLNFLPQCIEQKLLSIKSQNAITEKETTTTDFVSDFTESTKRLNFKTLNGGNASSYGVITEIEGEHFLIPPNCYFHNIDVKSMSINDKFDLIILDPPWWNKYIRRVKKANEHLGYSMLYNEDICNIPIENLTNDNGIVAIWCTNAKSHIEAIKNDFLPKWNLKLLAVWFWIKISKYGHTICDFNEANQKQPFERLFICCNSKASEELCNKIPQNYFIYSVPSGIHSHKPPLFDIFKNITTGDKNLEIFARSLYSQCTSVGLEVLKLQNVMLFNKI